MRKSKLKTIRIILLAVCLLACCSTGSAQTKKAAAAAPEQVVKNLYAARKNPQTDPFFQHKNRQLVDKYFTRNFADVIWKDATAPGEGVGALDFDPLFYAQDVRIANLIIGKADENEMVKVRFKNMNTDEEIKFFLTKENAHSKVWKIDSIVYSDAEDLGSIIEYGMMSEAEMKDADSQNKLDGDYLIGTVKCHIASTKSGYWARIKCDDQPNFQVIDTETLSFGTFNPNEKGRKGKFVLLEDGTIGKFVDAAGKEIKVFRVHENSHRDVRTVDFLNYDYQSSICSEDLGISKTVKVRMGEFQDGSIFYNVIDKKVVYGDVNLDGLEDALVKITCGDAAGTLRGFEIHTYTFLDEKAKLLSRLDSRMVERDYKKFYPAGVVFALNESDIKIQDGHLIVRVWADGSFAGPENIATFDYKLRGGKHVLSRKPMRVRAAY